ncbi:MAG: DNA repair protein RadC [Candidatus Cloacimonetes bacterium]|nr:DNA repair protein RadC [Candidatus Cloacimonadota bacterium]
MQEIKDKSEGHRRRLREKFIKTGISGFHDYEIVELLLTLGTPRKDCKQQAKKAIKKFKSLKGVLEAPMDKLQEIDGIGTHNAFGIKLFQEISERYLKERIIGKEIKLKSSKEVYDYLFQSMQKNKKEIFKVLFLDAKNKIINTEDLFEGSLNSSVVYPREIMKKAIEYNAVSLIFVHNHPSGNPEPSQSDKDITKNLVNAGKVMQIKILDHIIIGDNRYFSFADDGLIDEYNLNFLSVQKGNKDE